MGKTTPIVETIIGERAWRYTGSNGRFIISSTTEQYTLNYSADGVSWTAWGEATPVGEPCLVTNAATGMFFKCDGLSATTKVAVTF